MFTCNQCFNSYSSKQRLTNHACVSLESKITTKDQLLLVIDVITKIAKRYDLHYAIVDNQTSTNCDNSNNTTINIYNNNNLSNIHMHNSKDNIDINIINQDNSTTLPRKFVLQKSSRITRK